MPQGVEPLYRYRIVVFGKTGVGKSRWVRGCGGDAKVASIGSDPVAPDGDLQSTTAGVERYQVLGGKLELYDTPGTDDVSQVNGTGRDTQEIMAEILRGLARFHTTHVDLIIWMTGASKTDAGLNNEAKIMQVLCRGDWSRVLILGRLGDGGNTEDIQNAKRGRGTAIRAAMEAANEARSRQLHTADFMEDLRKRCYTVYYNPNPPDAISIDPEDRYVRFGAQGDNPTPDVPGLNLAIWLELVCKRWAQPFEINRVGQICVRCFQGPMDQLAMRRSCHSHARRAHTQTIEEWVHTGAYKTCHGAKIIQNDSTQIMPLVAPLAGLGGVVDATAAGFPQMAPIVGAALLWDTWNAWSAKRNGLCDECGRKVEDKKSTPCLGYFDCCPRMISRNGEQDLAGGAGQCPSKRKRFTCHHCHEVWHGDETEPPKCGFVCNGPDGNPSSLHIFHEPNQDNTACVDLSKTASDHEIKEINQGGTDDSDLREGFSRVNLGPVA